MKGCADLPSRPLQGNFASLQCLRGLAALLVVLVHAAILVQSAREFWPLPDFVRAGAMGVDLFFCISGFIMYHTSAEGFAVPGETARFLRRRFLRIYPPYWIVFGLTLLVGWLLPAYVLPSLELTPGYLTKSFLLLPQDLTPLVQQSWTLVHEIRFYALFGLSLALPRKQAVRALVAWGAGSLVVLVLSYVEAMPWPHSLAGRILNYVFHPNSLEFLLGVVAAAIVRHVRTSAATDLKILSAGLIFALASLFGFTSLPFETKYRVLTVFMLPSFLLILGGVLWERRAARKLPPLLIVLGDASYSIYLTHWLFMQFVIPRCFFSIESRQAVVAQTWVVVVLALIVGWIFHRVVERPLHGLARRWARPKSAGQSPRSAVAMSKTVVK